MRGARAGGCGMRELGDPPAVPTVLTLWGTLPLLLFHRALTEQDSSFSRSSSGAFAATPAMAVWARGLRDLSGLRVVE